MLQELSPGFAPTFRASGIFKTINVAINKITREAKVIKKRVSRGLEEVKSAMCMHMKGGGGIPVHWRPIFV